MAEGQDQAASDMIDKMLAGTLVRSFGDRGWSSLGFCLGVGLLNEGVL